MLMKSEIEKRLALWLESNNNYIVVLKRFRLLYLIDPGNEQELWEQKHHKVLLQIENDLPFPTTFRFRCVPLHIRILYIVLCHKLMLPKSYFDVIKVFEQPGYFCSKGWYTTTQVVLRHTTISLPSIKFFPFQIHPLQLSLKY